MLTTCTTNKPLPPFGKSLIAKRQKGIQPNNDIFLFLGNNAWEHAKKLMHQQVVLVLPKQANPYKFYWPVADCSILIFITSPLVAIDIRKTAHALLLAGAHVVRVISGNNLAVYKP